MRIGFDAKRYFFNKTGLGNYSRDLIRMLQHYHREHSYIKYTPKLPANQNTTGDFSEHTKTPKNKISKFFSSLWRQKWIVGDLAQDHIDVFHGLSGEIPMGLKRKQIKSVVTIHDLIFLKLPELYHPIDRFLYNQKFKYSCHHADKIIAISEQTKNDIIAYYQIPAEKITVIYQGCHPAFKTAKSDLEKKLVREKYNLPKKFLLNVGSIEPRKNALQIVKAIENIDIPLLIIGKQTKYAAEIKTYIEERQLQISVFIREGFSMEELATIYAMAEIFVYPSQYEGFGIPIIEALYAGTPVITNKSGVFSEAGGPNSHYIDVDSVEELTGAIKLILSSNDLRDKMISEGKIFVERFNDETIANQLNNLYLNLH